MKVIKKGEGWHKQLTCKGCSAILKVESGDILYEVTSDDARHYQDQSDIEGSYSVNCPECGYRIIIKKTYIPDNIREFLKDR